MRVLSVIGDGASVAGILLEEIDEPADGLLIVFVLLALDDNLGVRERPS